MSTYRSSDSGTPCRVTGLLIGLVAALVTVQSMWLAKCYLDPPVNTVYVPYERDALYYLEYNPTISTEYICPKGWVFFNSTRPICFFASAYVIRMNGYINERSGRGLFSQEADAYFPTRPIYGTVAEIREKLRQLKGTCAILAGSAGFLGGRYAEIQNTAENREIHRLTIHTNIAVDYWLLGNNRTSVYFNWDPDHSDSNLHPYVFMNRGGKWQAFDGKHSFNGVVCEVEPRRFQDFLEDSALPQKSSWDEAVCTEEDICRERGWDCEL